MRQFFASDLHLGVEPQGDLSVRSLASYVCKYGRPEDVLCVAGDLAVTDAGIGECLDLFSDFQGKKMAIAGNHDVWTTDGSSSLDRYNGLPQIFERSGFHPLEEEPITVGGVGFVGAMGWYDYSFKDESLGHSPDEYLTKTPAGAAGPQWNDAFYVHWPMSDVEATSWQLERLERSLAAVRGVNEIVAIIHHVPTVRLLVHPRSIVPPEWRFVNAFLGSDRFAEALKNCGRTVRLAVCGHLHLPQDARVGCQRYLCVGNDYSTKQLLVREGDAFVRVTF